MADLGEGSDGGEYGAGVGEPGVSGKSHWASAGDDGEGRDSDSLDLHLDETDSDSDDETAPFAANDENRQLDREVKRKHRTLDEVEAELEDGKDRVRVLADHLKSVRDELTRTESLLAARKRDVESEQHLGLLATREDSKIRLAAKKAQAQLAELTESVNANENNIFRCTQRLEEIQEDMSWNKQEMAAWLAKTKAVADDQLALERYKRADESKIKELNLAIQKLTTEHAAVRRTLEKEMTETHSQQLALDKIADEFRRIHEEREHLIGMWEATIAKLQACDTEIAASAEEFQTLKSRANQRAIEVRQQADFLKQEQENVAEAEKKIVGLERQVTRVRELQIRAVDDLQRFREEVEALQGILHRVSTDLNRKKNETKRLREEKTARLKKITELEASIAEAEETLSGAAQSKMTSEERTKQLEAMHEEEERDMKIVRKEIETMRAHQFKQQQKVHDLRQEQSLLEAAIEGQKAAKKNLSSKIRACDAEVLQQQQLLYQQDFQISQLERKLANLEGKRTKEEQLELDARKAELTAELDKHQRTRKLLLEQLKRSENETRKATRAKEMHAQHMMRLGARLQELEMLNAGAATELKTLTKTKENLMVEENVLKLETRRLRKLLNSRADNVLTLEHRRIELKAALEERREEIRIQKDLLNEQLRGLQYEKSTTYKEFREMEARVEKLKKRSEIVEAVIAPSEDGVVRSQAYYVIKAAQEREELQSVGDELDVKIQKGEKELRALENTLRLMDGRNAKLKSTARKVDSDSSEVAQRDELTAKLRTAMDKFKHKRRNCQAKREAVEELLAELDGVAADRDYSERRHQEAAAQLRALEADLEDQEEKNRRAVRQATKLIAQHRAAQGASAGAPTLAEMDFQYSQLKTFNTKALNSLREIVESNPDIRPQVTMLCQRANIKLPTAPISSRGSSMASGSHASRTSHASSRRAATSSGRTAADAAASHRARQGQAVAGQTVTLDLGGRAPPPVGSPRSGTRSKRPGSSRPTSTKSARPASGRSTRPPSARAKSSGRTRPS